MSYRLPPLRALRAFEAAARLGRMSAAAVELSVTPGAISRQVRQLEDHLCVPLFAGTKARPMLTTAARKLQPVLSTAFQQIEDAIRALGDERQGPLDVACFSTFTVKWLIPRLFDFHAQYPGIEVRLRSTDTGIDVGKEGCDLLITAEDAPMPRDTALPLFDERMGPVLAPTLAAHIGPLRTPGDLLNQRLLHTSARRDAWKQWAASTGAIWSEMASTLGPLYEHYYFTLEAAARGLGIALAPWHLVMDDIQAGRLVAPFGFTASGYVYSAVRRSAAPHPRLDAFCRWLMAQSQAMVAPAFAGHGTGVK